MLTFLSPQCFIPYIYTHDVNFHELELTITAIWSYGNKVFMFQSFPFHHPVSVRPDFTKKNLKKIRILLTYPREASDCFLFFWSFSLQLLKGYVAYIWNDHRSSLCAVFRRILFFLFFCSFSVHWFIRHFQPKCFVFSQDKGRCLQLILGHWAVRFPITG